MASNACDAIITATCMRCCCYFWYSTLPCGSHHMLQANKRQRHDQPAAEQPVLDLISALYDFTGARTSKDLVAKLKELSELHPPAERHTPECDVCKLPAMLSYFQLVSTRGK